MAVRWRLEGSVAIQQLERDDPDLEPLVGMFINTLVLRFALPSDR